MLAHRANRSAVAHIDDVDIIVDDKDDDGARTRLIVRLVR